MARIQPMNAAEARDALLDAAAAYVRVAADAVVLVTRGPVEVIRSGPPAAPAEGVSVYDASLLAALTDNAMSARRLARTAGRRFNSYFRERLSRLVEEGRIRRTRRGFARP